MSEKEIHYLKSILEQMRAFRTYMNTFDKGFSLSDMVLADNIDFLDCYIDRLERNV
jgi:hypothetical protein